MNPSNSRDMKLLILIFMATAFGLFLPNCATAPHCPDGEVEVAREVQSSRTGGGLLPWTGHHTHGTSLQCVPAGKDGGE